MVFGLTGAAMPAWGGEPDRCRDPRRRLPRALRPRRRRPDGDLATEFDEWCAEDSEIFADLEAGGDIRTLEQRFPDIIAIGEAPVAGSPAGE